MKTKQPKYEVTIPAKDLRRATFRSGGPGGQHQNVTDSGVRYTHIPSGIAAESRSDRSQHANDALALDSLKAKLLDIILMRRRASAQDRYAAKPEATYGTKMRSYVTVGHPRRVVDHETGWEGDPAKVLNGDLDELLRVRLQEAASQEREITHAAGTS